MKINNLNLDQIETIKLKLEELTGFIVGDIIRNSIQGDIRNNIRDNIWDNILISIWYIIQNGIEYRIMYTTQCIIHDNIWNIIRDNLNPKL